MDDFIAGKTLECLFGHVLKSHVLDRALGFRTTDHKKYSVVNDIGIIWLKFGWEIRFFPVLEKLFFWIAMTLK